MNPQPAHPEERLSEAEGASRRATWHQRRARILLGEALARSPSPKAAHYAAQGIDGIAARILAGQPVQEYLA